MCIFFSSSLHFREYDILDNIGYKEDHYHALFRELPNLIDSTILVSVSDSEFPYISHKTEFPVYLIASEMWLIGVCVCVCVCVCV